MFNLWFYFPYDRHKNLRASLLSLQKKETFASMVFGKNCYVACMINHFGKLICLDACLHEHDCVGLISKTGHTLVFLQFRKPDLYISCLHFIFIGFFLPWIWIIRIFSSYFFVLFLIQLCVFISSSLEFGDIWKK